MRHRLHCGAVALTRRPSRLSAPPSPDWKIRAAAFHFGARRRLVVLKSDKKQKGTGRRVGALFAILATSRAPR
jgi:hypothetical protein